MSLGIKWIAGAEDWHLHRHPDRIYPELRAIVRICPEIAHDAVGYGCGRTEIFFTFRYLSPCDFGHCEFGPMRHALPKGVMVALNRLHWRTLRTGGSSTLAGAARCPFSTFIARLIGVEACFRECGLIHLKQTAPEKVADETDRFFRCKSSFRERRIGNAEKHGRDLSASQVVFVECFGDFFQSGHLRRQVDGIAKIGTELFGKLPAVARLPPTSA